MNIADIASIGWDLAGLLRSSRWQRDTIRDYQAKALVGMMRHAVAQVPFYRATGIVAEDIRSPRDLERFPIISKATIREHNAGLIADTYDQSALKRSVTSGSTGEPTTTWFDRSTWLHDRYAQKIRRMVESDIGLFSRVLIASEFSQDSLRRRSLRYLPGAGFLFQQRRISVHQSPAEHIEIFREFRPHALYAFPSYLAELIDFCEAQSIRLPPLHVVFTSSEVLTDTLRARICAFFSTRVCDVYGSTEFKEVAWECKQERCHLNFESTYVESIPNSDGETSSLVMTTLTNRAMPLLRYRIGDLGEIRDQPCPCGRQSQWIDSIAGREVDILVLPSGRRVSPYVLVNENIDNTRDILKHQFVQTAPDRLEIRVTLAPSCREIGELQHLVQNVSERLDGEMHVTMVDVAKIPRTSGGKQHVLIRAAGAAGELLIESLRQ